MIRFYLFLVLFFVANIVFAQRFYGGVLFGINGSQVEGDRLSGYHKFGITGGGWVQTEIGNNAFIGMEVKYNQKGSQKQQNAKIGDLSVYTLRLNYAEIPIIVGVRYSEFIRIYGGLAYAHLMKMEELNNYGEYPEPALMPFRSSEISGLAGVKVDLSKWVESDFFKKISIDFRFQYSLLPARKYEGVDIGIFGAGQFNNVISAAIYYRIGSKVE